MQMYEIELTESAKVDLAWYRVYEQKMIVEQLIEHLQVEPTQETRNRKKLRDNPVASWELRIGKYRLFYGVLEDKALVSVVAVGHKEHNVLFIRGEEVYL